MRFKLTLPALHFFLFLLFAGPSLAQEPADRTSTPAARFGDQAITLEELYRATEKELNQIELQRHELLEQKLDQMISQRLLDGEAKRRGLSVERLLDEEVNRKAPKVSDEEVKDFIAKNQGRLSAGDDGELRLRVWDYLRGQKVNQQRSDYVRTLWNKAGVKVLLPEPAAARVQVDSRKGFVLGPKDAPVAIVEFSDFQCPFCTKGYTTIETQVLKDYGDKVKFYYKNYPLPFHPWAQPGAIAAECAKQQKPEAFWAVYKGLFEQQKDITADNVKDKAWALAADQKIDKAKFDDCFDNKKTLDKVKADQAEGSSVGVTGTPSFVINGRLIVGAQPYEAFKNIIDDELASAK